VPKRYPEEFRRKVLDLVVEAFAERIGRRTDHQSSLRKNAADSS
jgi:hypothetical protein